MLAQRVCQTKKRGKEMTRNEFIEKINGLGFNIRFDLGELIVEDEDEFVHAVISERVPFMIDTDFPHYADTEWEKVDKIICKDLFDAIVGYASTPIKKRTKEKYFLVVGNGLVYKEAIGSNRIFSIRRNVFHRVDGMVFENEEECRELARELGGEVVVATHYLNSYRDKDKRQWQFMRVDGELKLISIEIAND